VIEVVFKYLSQCIKKSVEKVKEYGFYLVSMLNYDYGFGHVVERFTRRTNLNDCLNSQI
jgi:hypothetical protein